MPNIMITRNIFIKIKKKTFQGSASVSFVSRVPLLYCLDVPYILVVAHRVKVDLSALKNVSDVSLCVLSLSHIVFLVRSNT